jgi:hypothetical protein
MRLNQKNALEIDIAIAQAFVRIYPNAANLKCNRGFCLDDLLEPAAVQPTSASWLRCFS